MKLMIMFINYPAFAQGLTSNGQNTSDAAKFVNSNGAIGTNLLFDKNEEIVEELVLFQNYQGGKIFYFLQVGDSGYLEGEQHGLIAAVNLLEDRLNKAIWTTYGVITNATGNTIGTGFANTTAIIAAQGPDEMNYAAGLARGYTGGGYTDWYLPSKDELYKLYLNKSVVNNFITTNLYWSSSETNQTTASTLRFTDGAVYNIQSKASEHAVRAVRTF